MGQDGRSVLDLEASRTSEIFQATYYQSKRRNIREDNNAVLTTIKTEREGNRARKKTDASGMRC